MKLFLLAAVLIGALVPSAHSQSGEFATGDYRNLFAENGHSASAVDKKISSAYQQLFHGNPLTQSLLFSAGSNSNGPLAYICDVASDDVRTEGMSYGMMIAVQLNEQADFDALWNWAQTHMYHASPESPACGFFSWSVKTDGTPNDEMAAPDGEEYFVTALFFADARWGSKQGIFNYRTQANHLLTNMRHRPFVTGPTVKGELTAGALFDEAHRMVRFTADRANCDHTDPSYQLPAFYELWARWGPEADRDFWKQAAAASREFFHAAANATTGLAPDYANFDGTPWAAPWHPSAANFEYDAWRTAMNWSVDWAWWGADPREQQLSDHLQAFFESKGISTYASLYQLDGAPLGGDHTTGLIAMNAVASLAATQPRAKEFAQALWNAPVPAGKYRYYDGMLYMLGMLHCGGEFKVWTPHP